LISAAVAGIAAKTNANAATVFKCLSQIAMASSYLLPRPELV
jgi:hypothetical protein